MCSRALVALCSRDYSTFLRDATQHREMVSSRSLKLPLKTLGFSGIGQNCALLHDLFEHICQPVSHHVSRYFCARDLGDVSVQGVLRNGKWVAIVVLK